MGESDEQLVDVAFALRELDADSIPVNFLHAIPGTPLEGRDELNPRRCLKILALLRLRLPVEGDPRRGRARGQPPLAAAARALPGELDLRRRLPHDAGPGGRGGLPDDRGPRVRDRGVRAVVKPRGRSSSPRIWIDAPTRDCCARCAISSATGAWVVTQDGRGSSTSRRTTTSGSRRTRTSLDAAARAAARAGGATASRLIVGTDPAYGELEEKLAELQGNRGCARPRQRLPRERRRDRRLVGRGDAIFSDEPQPREHHRRLPALSRAAIHRYRHGDAEHARGDAARVRRRGGS